MLAKLFDHLKFVFFVFAGLSLAFMTVHFAALIPATLWLVVGQAALCALGVLAYTFFAINNLRKGA